MIPSFISGGEHVERSRFLPVSLDRGRAGGGAGHRGVFESPPLTPEALTEGARIARARLVAESPQSPISSSIFGAPEPGDAKLRLFFLHKLYYEKP